ncbi:MAG: NTP transferase domain-containing protein [Deltaproteobacteria bacterium]|nr:NTP transferase domain-containing protein [Deltaproteobacteria bacterium]
MPQNQRHKACAVVLAGGQGVNCKALHASVLTAVALVEPLFEEVMISANETDDYRIEGIRVVPDRVKHQGSLMAIYSALDASSHEDNLVILPHINSINKSLVDEMFGAIKKDTEVVIPVTHAAEKKLFFAIYRKGVLKKIEQLFLRGEMQLKELLPLCRVKYVLIEDKNRGGYDE